MNTLANDPRDFAMQALDGFVLAYPDYVQAVHGGVVRRHASPGEVALVFGGGSGHYPAFAGWIGPGMGHGAACGNIFASPSASQICSVARAASNGSGVLFGFGNYAGDVLHFGLAAEQLRGEGMDVRLLTVTDDVASGRPERRGDRRGIAGDLVVFKIAGAAAASGSRLDEVERVAIKANLRTVTLGVAFSGCTLPGADAPLFTLKAGQMGLGLGVHGEPGIEELPQESATDLARRLVRELLREAPPAHRTGGDIAVVLNGLGSVTQEELFVLYSSVAPELTMLGYRIVEPEVGNHLTSLDMAGVSLTICFLDDELESLWRAPVDTPALRKGDGADAAPGPRSIPEFIESDLPPGTAPSQKAANLVVELIGAANEVLDREEQALGRLDAIAGDGDHGIGMSRGARAALKAAQSAVAAGAGAGSTLACAGAAWAESAGGTSGALWGAALKAAGNRLGDQEAPTKITVVEALRAGADVVQRLGAARIGDKTMVDAIVPFLEALESAEAPLAHALVTAAVRAEEAAADTSRIIAHKGRARVHGDRSLGTPDPGAVSFALIVRAVARHVTKDA